MVTLPREFVATKFPGYFWNTTEKKLYSVKVSGYLHPLKSIKPSHFNDWTAGYKVSVQGERRWLRLDYLNRLRPNEDTVYPVQVEVAPKPKNPKVTPPAEKIQIVSTTINLSLCKVDLVLKRLSVPSKVFGGAFPLEIVVQDDTGESFTFVQDEAAGKRNDWWDDKLMRYVPSPECPGIQFLVVYHEY
jgi:hypothetical protein